ncbi:MAG: hypothetical protein K2G93_02270 [Rikenella sp.]|nr:hypothetical protein [Rikenella sp.]
MIFFTEVPAPGLRGYEHGKIRSVGSGGFGWSLSVTSTYAYDLNFYHDGVHSNHQGNRSYGFQLRCLQE